MAINLPPPPLPNKDMNTYPWRDWFRKVRDMLHQTGSIAWSLLDFTGSNLTDIETRNHNDLQSKQGGTTNEFYHLTSSEYSVLAPESASRNIATRVFNKPPVMVHLGNSQSILENKIFGD